MYKLIGFFLSIFFYTFLFSGLLLFDLVQRVIVFFFNAKAHEKAINIVCFLVLKTHLILGTRFYFKNEYLLPLNQSFVFISNHQSFYDIPPIIWFLRKHSIKFIGKKELERGLPSVSFFLRKGGGLLIDRRNAKEALNSIGSFCKKVTENNWSIAIFPEGTRSKKGMVRRFKRNGLEKIIEEMPDVVLVPISINNSYKLNRWKAFPLPLGTRISLEVHKPIKTTKETITKTIDKVEQIIREGVQTNS